MPQTKQMVLENIGRACTQLKLKLETTETILRLVDDFYKEKDGFYITDGMQAALVYLGCLMMDEPGTINREFRTQAIVGKALAVTEVTVRNSLKKVLEISEIRIKAANVKRRIGN